MILGLTGGVATGKSTAAAELAALGARVIDCDELARFLPRYDISVLAALSSAFPEVFDSADRINRPALADLVFQNETRRRQLESILHPPIMAIVKANVTFARQRGKHLVVDIPLLFEGGYQSLFDRTWVVTSSEQTQIERLARRSGLNEKDARLIIDSQMPLKDKELQADTIIVNNRGLAELREAVKLEWERELGNDSD